MVIMSGILCYIYELLLVPTDNFTYLEFVISIFRFGFVGSGTSSGQFVIEEITGVIRLHSKSISLERDKYELNVTAVDDGACCVNGAATIHTSTAVVVVFITDVNDNKPVFRECAKYNPKVEEGAPNGSPVLKVRKNYFFC